MTREDYVELRGIYSDLCDYTDSHGDMVESPNTPGSALNLIRRIRAMMSRPRFDERIKRLTEGRVDELRKLLVEEVHNREESEAEHVQRVFVLALKLQEGLGFLLDERKELLADTGVPRGVPEEEGCCCVCQRTVSAVAKPIVDHNAYPDEGEWFCSKRCQEAYHAAEGDYEKARESMRQLDAQRLVELPKLMHLVAELNLSESALDESVHELKSREASSINNDGWDAQVAYLYRHLGSEETMQIIRNNAGDPRRVEG